MVTMLKTRRLVNTLIIILGVAVSWTAAALQVHDYQGTPYASGGIGAEEQEQLKTMAGRFNLKLVFADRSGEFLADIQVHIQDPQSKVVLEAVSTGPWFYAKLPPGAYTVQVSGFGQQFERQVQVEEKGLREFVFRWK